MAKVKISQLPRTEALAGNELIAGVQGSLTVTMTVDEVNGLVLSPLSAINGVNLVGNAADKRVLAGSTGAASIGFNDTTVDAELGRLNVDKASSGDVATLEVTKADVTVVAAIDAAKANIADLTDNEDSEKGAGLIGYQGSTVAVALDGRVPFADPEKTIVSAPYILRQYEGLNINRFLSTNDIGVDQAVKLSDAFAELRSTGRYTELDLEGRRIGISGSLDFGSIWGGANSQSFITVKNGWLQALDTAEIDPGIVRNITTTVGSPEVSISSAVGITPGMYVTGPALARETYVREVDLVNNKLTLNTNAWRSLTATNHRFREFAYMLDFKGVPHVQNMSFENIIFNAGGRMSVFRGPQDGDTFVFKGCAFQQPQRRGITFWAHGGSNLQVDNCTGRSSDGSTNPDERETVFCNVTTNDAKFRGNYIWQFRHTLVLHGSGNVLTGNHFWQGHPTSDARTASIILTTGNNKTNITGNYIDNSWIELANDNSAQSNLPLGGGVTITGNQFTVSAKNTSFGWVALHPYRENSLVRRISVVGNVFKNVDNQGTPVPVTSPDFVILGDGAGSIDRTSCQEVFWYSNSYNQVTKRTASVVSKRTTIAAGSETNTVGFDFTNTLPWNMYPQTVTGTIGTLVKDATGTSKPVPMMANNSPGGMTQNIRLSEPCSGSFTMTVDCNPPS